MGHEPNKMLLIQHWKDQERTRWQWGGEKV